MINELGLIIMGTVMLAVTPGILFIAFHPNKRQAMITEGSFPKRMLDNKKKKKKLTNKKK